MMLYKCTYYYLKYSLLMVYGAIQIYVLLVLELCHTCPAVTPPTLIELCRAWPAVTPPTLIELCRAWPAVTTPTILEPHVHCTHIQQSGLSVKSMNAKNTKKSLIHENADANITCDFGDINRFRSQLPHTRPHTWLHR